jgi:hexosaminidase
VKPKDYQRWFKINYFMNCRNEWHYTRSGLCWRYVGCLFGRIGCSVGFLCFLTLAAFGAGAYSLIPLPQKIEAREGTFALNRRTQIVVKEADSQATFCAKYLAERLRNSTGYAFKVRTASEWNGTRAIQLRCGDLEAGSSSEGYVLDVGQDAVVIRARGGAGLFYGVQTLLELAPPEALGLRPIWLSA